jgi:RND family efflux transporter MFP subunit
MRNQDLTNCAVVVGALLALGCGDGAPAGQGGGAKPPGASAPAREVQLARVERQQLAKTVAVTGTLAADEQVTVGVNVPGRLASIAVDLGSVVKRGQAIAQIEATDYQLRVEQAASALAQARALLGLPPEGDDATLDLEATSLVREAQATLQEARANLERARTLSEQKLIAQAELDTAQASFVRAETAVARARDEIRTRQASLRQRSFELRLARQQLGDTVVRAPLDGIVQQRLVQAGEFLAAGASVVSVVRVDPLRLRAEIPERDASLVHPGQSVTITVDGDGSQHEGKLVRLAPALSEQNRSLAVEAEFANDNGALRPGSFARGAIVVDDPSQALVVPTRAIVSFAGIDKVITIEAGKAVEHEVETGRRAEPWTEVVAGVDAGVEVVLDPGNLQQGQPVTVAPRVAATAGTP